jgi:hypothetical protein
VRQVQLGKVMLVVQLLLVRLVQAVLGVVAAQVLLV